MDQSPLATAIREAESALFPYMNDEEDFIVVDVEDQSVLELCERIIKPYYPDRETVYGQAHDLIGFLRREGRDLLTKGLSHTKIDWIDATAQQPRKRRPLSTLAVLPSLVPLNARGVQLKRDRGGNVQYRITPAKAHWWESERLGSERPSPRYDLDQEQMLVLQSPLANPSVLPIAGVVDDYFRSLASMQASLTATAARALPRPIGIRYQAGALRSLAAELRKQRISQMRIYDRCEASLIELGAWPGLMEPVTDYFLAWQHIKSRKRLSRLRESMLDQFSRQVVHPFLSRNGVNSQVRIHYAAMPSQEDLDVLLTSFENDEISLDELYTRSQRSAETSSAGTAASR